MINELSEKEARDLARQIVSDNKSVRVKFGRTNGLNVLHVFVPGQSISRTIKCAADWADHPANEVEHRSRREQKEKDAEQLVIKNKGLST